MAKLDRLFNELKDQGGSDLHLSVGHPPLLRLSGHLVPVKGMPILEHQMLLDMLKEIMLPQQFEKFEENHDLDFAYSLENVARFRANTFYDQRGCGAVFRIIPTDILTIEKAGFHPSVTKLAQLEKGLCLVTGPTGSGKSTTMAAMIDHINSHRDCHIVMIEDPIEFVHPQKRALMTQREVHYDARSFASALRAACREDPDVILVGEMRDLETISLALTAAELGILVFGTLHTNSASKTVDRIIDAFPSEEQSQVRSMLADSLKGVIAQQLIRKKDGRGRCAALEILIGSNAMGNIIREGKTTQIPSLMQTGSAEGMLTMDMSLLKLFKEGAIDQTEALLRASDKKVIENA